MVSRGSFLQSLLCSALIFALVSSSNAASSFNSLLSSITSVKDIDSAAFNSNVDLIRDLPGAPDVPFKMFSGYITVDEDAGRALFYWFVEAEEEAHSAPVTLWLNGGPGCSSIGGGMLSELGPFYPDKSGELLLRNPNSWNRVSNMIFLESPAGVGFSYSNTSSDYTTGDHRTAKDSYVFLQRFFAKYPGYATNSFFIAGESYGGHYVPNLADIIVKGNNDLSNAALINLKGFLVGNAWTDAGIDNYGAAFFWWSHALISDRTFRGLIDTCDFSSIGPLRRAVEGATCDTFVDRADAERGNINIYEIYADVCVPKSLYTEQRQLAKHLAGLGPAGLSTRHLLHSTYDPCIDSEVEVYLNRPDVQKALHVNVTGGLPGVWEDCSEALHYSREDLLHSMLLIYRRLLKAGIEIFVFSGDVDGIVPVTGTRAWLSKLELSEEAAWRPWMLDHQVGGYVTEYDGLRFATVRQAGHMVPYTQPERALHLFKSFILDTPL